MAGSPSFLRRFSDYLKSRTDCPPAFFPHAGMVALATALGNRVYSDGWSRPIYPNLWVVVIAPSGFGKSVPLDYSRDLVEMAGMGDNILPDSFSGEALYQVLAKESVGTFYLQEFASFMGTLGRDYNSGAMNWLTAIYDVPPSDKRVLSGREYVLRKPCVSILGASSPDWFAETYRASHLRGGFLARFLFCPAKEAGKAVDFPGPRNQALENTLADHLRQVQQLAGPADFSAVTDAYNTWARKDRQHARGGPPEFSGMRSRAGALVRKAAMLFAVSRDPTSLRVTKEDFDNAVWYVETSHKAAEEYLTNEVAHGVDDAKRLRVLELVRRAGGRMARSDVLRSAHLSSDELNKAVRTLVEAGWLQEQREGRAAMLVTDFTIHGELLRTNANPVHRNGKDVTANEPQVTNRM